jgi:hypothetical protein
MTYLKDSYQRFLANPRTAPLAANASLIYIPTTTKIEGADAIATHTSRQASVVKKNSDRIINAIESSDALCLDMETTLEFVEGGGAYLPSLDDNFLADRVVTFPTVNNPRSRSCCMLHRTKDVPQRARLMHVRLSTCRSTSSTSTPNNKSNKSASIGTRARY